MPGFPTHLTTLHMFVTPPQLSGRGKSHMLGFLGCLLSSSSPLPRGTGCHATMQGKSTRRSQGWSVYQRMYNQNGSLPPHGGEHVSELLSQPTARGACLRTAASPEHSTDWLPALCKDSQQLPQMQIPAGPHQTSPPSCYSFLLGLCAKENIQESISAPSAFGTVTCHLRWRAGFPATTGPAMPVVNLSHRDLR